MGIWNMRTTRQKFCKQITYLASSVGKFSLLAWDVGSIPKLGVHMHLEAPSRTEKGTM